MTNLHHKPSKGEAVERPLVEKSRENRLNDYRCRVGHHIKSA